MRAHALLATALLFAGCQSADPPGAGTGADASAASDAGGETSADAAPTPTARCTGLAPQEADRLWTLSVGDRDRSFWVHVPSSYDPERPTPVVLDFHGYSSNATQQALWSGMNTASDADGFIAVHPEGIGVTPSWNAGACCGEAAAQGVDDVAFVSALIDAVAGELCVDPSRVYATGMSNGGFLSHRLGCELSDRIAAIAPVAGVLGDPTCAPARPVPVMEFHGTLDTVVPFAGDAAAGFPSVEDTIDGWARRDGCRGDPETVFEQGDTQCNAWTDCDGGAEVVLCVIDGGGHTWPGGVPVPALGHTSTDISATDAAWEFFMRHPLPPHN